MVIVGILGSQMVLTDKLQVRMELDDDILIDITEVIEGVDEVVVYQGMGQIIIEAHALDIHLQMVVFEEHIVLPVHDEFDDFDEDEVLLMNEVDEEDIHEVMLFKQTPTTHRFQAMGQVLTTYEVIKQIQLG